MALLQIWTETGISTETYQARGRWGAYIDYSSSVAGEEKLSLQPLVVDAFIEAACHYGFVGRFTSCLLDQERTVECVQAYAVSATDNNVSADIIELGALSS